MAVDCCVCNGSIGTGILSTDRRNTCNKCGGKYHVDTCEGRSGL